MPELPTGRSGCRPLSQPLKSPMTETYSADGAQTAKRVPTRPFSVIGWAPSFSYSRLWLPSLKRYRSSAVSTFMASVSLVEGPTDEHGLQTDEHGPDPCSSVRNPRTEGPWA